MKERPILFSTEMVRAILEGRKTQTRSVVKPQPPEGFAIVPRGDIEGWMQLRVRAVSHYPVTVTNVRCPYGVPGDRLWVRETWWMHDDPSAFDPNDGNVTDFDGRTRVVGYAASMDFDSVRIAKEYGARRRSSIHMPRWASRITLEVTDVRVERLRDISDADGVAEGYQSAGDFLNGEWAKSVGMDCWVWAITFKVVKP